MRTEAQDARLRQLYAYRDTLHPVYQAALWDTADADIDALLNADIPALTDFADSLHAHAREEAVAFGHDPAADALAAQVAGWADQTADFEAHYTPEDVIADKLASYAYAQALAHLYGEKP